MTRSNIVVMVGVSTCTAVVIGVLLASMDRQAAHESPAIYGEQASLAVATDAAGRDEMPFAFAGQSDVGSEQHQMFDAFKKALVAGDSELASKLRPALLEMGVDAVPSLIAMVNCGDATCELEALRLLVQIGDGKGLAVALGKVLVVPESELPGYLRVFGECRDAGTIQWIVGFLGRTDDEETRHRIHRIIQSLNDPEASAELAATGEYPADDLHGRDAVSLLAKANSPLQVEKLIEVYHYSGSQDVQTSVVYALAGAGTSDALQFLATEAGKSMEMSRVCLDAIEGVTSIYAQEHLIKIAYDRSAGADVRSAALVALSMADEQRAGHVLVNLLGSSAPASSQVPVSSSQESSPSSGGSSAVAVTESRDERWY